jgi:hypothetical protein
VLFVIALTVVVYAVKYWYITMPIAVIVAIVVIAGRKAGRRAREEAETAERLERAEAEKAAAARREQQRQADEHARERWLAAPPPALVSPGRFTDRWFADNIPQLHPGQVPMLRAELRARGWKDDRVEQRVGPYLARNPWIQSD